MYDGALKLYGVSVSDVGDIASTLDQYQRLVERANVLFDVITEKAGAAWFEDGIGSCGEGPDEYGTGLHGGLKTYLPIVWQRIVVQARKEEEMSADFGHVACPFHATGKGCVLGSVKPMTCVSDVEQPDDVIQQVIGLKQRELTGLLRRALGEVMGAPKAWTTSVGEVDTEKVEASVNETLRRLDDLIAKARKSNVLCKAP